MRWLLSEKIDRCGKKTWDTSDVASFESNSPRNWWDLRMIGPKWSKIPSFSQQNCGGRTIIVQYPLISFDSLTYHLEKSNHVLWTKISAFLGCRSCLQLKLSSWMGMTKVHFQGSCHLSVKEDNPRTYLALLFDDWCWNPSALLCVSLKTSGSPKAKLKGLS